MLAKETEYDIVLFKPEDPMTTQGLIRCLFLNLDNLCWKQHGIWFGPKKNSFPCRFYFKDQNNSKEWFVFLSINMFINSFITHGGKDSVTDTDCLVTCDINRSTTSQQTRLLYIILNQLILSAMLLPMHKLITNKKNVYSILRALLRRVSLFNIISNRDLQQFHKFLMSHRSYDEHPKCQGS